MGDDGNPAHAAPLGPVAGAACGLAAAVLYTGANIALKASTGSEAILVSAVKAWPTVLACAPLLAVMAARGRKIATSWQTFPLLLGGVLVGQLIGSVMFQVSLGVVGLALAVPLNLGVMIICAAWFGWLLLGEPVTRRTVAAIVVLVSAVFVLTLGSDALAVREGLSAPQLVWGVVAAGTSGAAYAFFGATMRKSLRQGLTVPLAMLVSGVVGSVLLSGMAVRHVGVDAILATPAQQWVVMGAAGWLNVIAFFLLSFSLRSIPVVAVNLLNGTQAAMAAAAGVLLFGELWTIPLGCGLMLTLVGLAILGTGRRNAV